MSTSTSLFTGGIFFIKILTIVHEYLKQHSLKSEGTNYLFRWIKVPSTAYYWTACYNITPRTTLLNDLLQHYSSYDIIERPARTLLLVRHYNEHQNTSNLLFYLSIRTINWHISCKIHIGFFYNSTLYMNVVFWLVDERGIFYQSLVFSTLSQSPWYLPLGIPYNTTVL
jgi:hypothetical protein